MRGKRAAWLFLVFLAWPLALVTPTGAAMSDSVLLAAIRLVDRQTWTLSDEPDPKVVFQTEAFDISVHDQRVYSGVGPGASVLAAPFYLAFRPLLARFDEGVIANKRFAGYYRQNRRLLGRSGASRLQDLYLLQILLAWLVAAPLLASLVTRLYRTVVLHGFAREAALAIATSVGLGSMGLYYGAMYSRVGLAYGLAGHALLSLVGGPGTARPGKAACAVAGAFLGAAFAIDYASAILVALSLLFLLPRLSGASRALVLLPLLACVGMTALYHQVAFGSPFATPYHHRYFFTPEALPGMGLDLSPFRENPAVQLNTPQIGVLWELCFGSYKGVFVYSPVLLLGLGGHLAGLGDARFRRFHVFSLVVFLSYLTFNSTLGARNPEEYARLLWGGLSVLWGPRHLYAVLPFLACGLVALDWRRSVVRTVAWALVLVSCAINLAGAMFSDVLMSVYAFGPELRSPVAYVFGLLRLHGPRLPLLDSYGVSSAVQWSILLALAVASAIVLWREARGRPAP